MKKKLLSILLAGALALSFGVGTGAWYPVRLRQFTRIFQQYGFLGERDVRRFG